MTRFPLRLSRDARFANRNLNVILLREMLYSQMSPDEQRAMRERAILRNVDYD